jgi:hypothetical protein
MFIFYVCCVGSGLCEGLITRSEESYRVCVCVYVCARASKQVWERFQGATPSSVS